MCHGVRAQEGQFEMPWLYCLQSLLLPCLQSTYIPPISKPPPCRKRVIAVSPSHTQHLLTCQPSSPWSKAWTCPIISTTWMRNFQYHQGNFFPLKFPETDRPPLLNFSSQFNVMQILHGKFWLNQPRPGKLLNWKQHLKIGNGKQL